LRFPSRNRAFSIGYRHFRVARSRPRIHASYLIIVLERERIFFIGNINTVFRKVKENVDFSEIALADQLVRGLVPSSQTAA
jgi:hypothetical protein